MKENTMQGLAPLMEELSKNLLAVAKMLRSQQKEEKPATPKKEAPTSSVTIEQVRAVLAEKSQAGLTGKVKELLEAFGSAKLSGIEPEKYADLYAAARELQ